MLKNILILFFLRNFIFFANAEHSFELFSSTSKHLKSSDQIECQVVKQDKQESSDCDTKYSVGQDYAYFEASTSKCFSFHVQASNNVHIAFSSVPKTNDHMMEIVLRERSIIRYRGERKSNPFLMSVPTTNVLSDTEYRGFWVTWNDDGYIEIGRENENQSLIAFQFPPEQRPKVNYIGLVGWQVYSSWIIHKNPKCPSLKDYKKIKATKLSCTKTEPANNSPKSCAEYS